MKKFIKSLFTDSEWDGDTSKVVGWILITIGIIGFFIGKNDFQWIIGFGTGLIGIGKVSTQG